ncbi:hypothetical protein G6011_05058 [Alternaria panax]|uniref:Uncharacterized protein n=1 Tax=Alternaria panax TaxID=48097 RepID=A0AAD4FCC9_9PLEO|nr:hypothetical protein G6011_05058 [Alternaria panax]
MGAKNFQNYAIKRLFEAFSRPLSQPLTPALLPHMFRRHKSSLIGLCPGFRKDFLAATEHPLEKEREKELSWAKYLID